MIGVTDSDDFLTSICSALGSEFWNLFVFDDTLHTSLPLTAVGIDPLLLASLASSVGSWKTGNLTISLLADIPGD